VFEIASSGKSLPVTLQQPAGLVRLVDEDRT